MIVGIVIGSVAFVVIIVIIVIVIYCLLKKKATENLSMKIKDESS